MSTEPLGDGAPAPWRIDDAERWRRRAAVEQARERRSSPTTTATVETTAEIGAPAAAVWAIMTDPAGAAVVLEHPPLVACTAPWTPDGAVGELSCVVTRMPDGTVRAGIEETLVREPGRRLVSRGRTSPMPGTADWTIEPTGPDRCTVRVVMSTQAPTGTAWLVRSAYRAGLRGGLWRLRRALGDPTVAGEPEPRLPWLERQGRLRAASRAARLATGARVRVGTVRSLLLPVPAEHVWALVRATGSPVVEHGDPSATCFTPDGGPTDAPGALRLVVGRDPVGDLELQAEEVTGVVPGVRLEARDVAAFGPSALVTLAPAGAGCVVGVLLAQEVAPRQAAATEVTLTRRAEAYLDRLGRATTGMPPLPLEEAWVG